MAFVLPVELITAIAELCPRSDWHGLCRINWAFRRAVERLLYRHIRIVCPHVHTKLEANAVFGMIAGLHDALVHDKEKAGVVRRFEVVNLTELDPSEDLLDSYPDGFTATDRMLPPDSGSETSDSDQDVGLPPIPQAVAAILSLLPGLLVLHISGQEWPNDAFTPVQLLKYIYSPNLREFTLDVARDDTDPQSIISHFLQRHTQLRMVGLEIQRLSPHDVPDTFRMSKIRTYEAPAPYFEGLDEHAPLQHALVDFPWAWFQDESTPFIDLISPIISKLHTFSSLRSFCVVLRHITPNILGVISTNLPRLEYLTIQHSDFVPRSAGWFPASVSPHVDWFFWPFSSFVALKELSFEWYQRHVTIRDEYDPDSAYGDIVVELGDVCPTLKSCCIYGDTWTKVEGEWVM